MKSKILERIKENTLVAVVRGENDVDAINISKEIIKGGIKTIELTFSTPFVHLAITELRKLYASKKEILIGAGTVLDDMTAVLAIHSGAQFIVSPHFDEKIAKACNRYQIPYLPGCMSVTEVVKALESGADVVKLFPGGTLKPSYIKDIRGPLKNVQAMPSGGVSIDNMHEWLEAGAYAIGIGSALTKYVKEKGYESVKKETAKFVKKLKEIR